MVADSQKSSNAVPDDNINIEITKATEDSNPKSNSKQSTATMMDTEDPDIARMQPGVATGRYEVMVKEKKGFFGSAIPAKLPCCIAVLLCFFNCVVPGLGTFISAPFSLCEKNKLQKRRIRNFFVNILTGFLQLVTSILLIGWLWSIMWAIEFLKPLKGEGYEES